MVLTGVSPLASSHLQMPKGFGADRKGPSFEEFSEKFPNGYPSGFDFNKPPPNFNNKAPPEGFGEWFTEYMKDHQDEFKQKYGYGKQEGMPEPPRPKPKPKRNLYQVLNLTPRATQENIKKSFRKLARELHPDKHSGSKKKEMEEKFVELANAYEILSDPKKRRRYDMGGPNAMGEMGPDNDDGEYYDDFGGFSSSKKLGERMGEVRCLVHNQLCLIPFPIGLLHLLWEVLLCSLF